MVAATTPHFTLWNLGPQQLHLDFAPDPIVSDAGLLAVRAVERPLGVIAGLAALLPDPRSPDFITHSLEALLTQDVYSLLAGYPDHNDANDLRTDPLFQVLAEVSPEPARPLASGSTLARLYYAYTRREAELPLEERPVLFEVRTAQTQRVKITNRYLVDLFIRTRRTPPTEIILDLDTTDDPVHGRQHLSGYHAYYRQHQYLPLQVYEGHTGFPLAAWLRPGTLSASVGAVDILTDLVTQLRAAWPKVRILARADNGVVEPTLLQYCEDNDVDYIFGYATNAVLERATAQIWSDMELYYRFYGRRDPHAQRFEDIRDYQAGKWPHPRRIVVKVEFTPQGSQRRFVVTNLQDRAAVVYQQIYVQRGAVPEQPIGEMKNGLRSERLSAHGFCANAFRLVLHALAYAIVVLFREACAGVPEVAQAQVSSLRQRLWKVGAVVVSSARRISFHLSGGWPYQEVFGRVLLAVRTYVQQWEVLQLHRVGLSGVAM